MQGIDQAKKSSGGTARRVLRRIAIDGVLGAACGGLYGLVFGGFGALVHGEPWKLVSIAIHFGGWGFAAGALVATCAVLFRTDGEADRPIELPPDSARDKQSHLEVVRHLMTPSQRPAPKSLASATRTNRSRSQTVGT
jgi:hypothetical protein